MLSPIPLKPVPHTCLECELSFPLGDEKTVGMVCCIRNNTHHSSTQPLCGWYVRLGYQELRVELAFKVPPWRKATAIRDLPQPASLEAIVNIIEGRTDKALATVNKEDHEKPPENQTPH